MPSTGWSSTGTRRRSSATRARRQRGNTNSPCRLAPTALHQICRRGSRGPVAVPKPPSPNKTPSLFAASVGRFPAARNENGQSDVALAGPRNELFGWLSLAPASPSTLPAARNRRRLAAASGGALPVGLDLDGSSAQKPSQPRHLARRQEPAPGRARGSGSLRGIGPWRSVNVQSRARPRTARRQEPPPDRGAGSGSRWRRA